MAGPIKLEIFAAAALVLWRRVNVNKMVRR